MKTWPIRRKDREMPADDVLALLRSADWGMLSLTTSDGAPYGVPLNYAFNEESGVLVFHGSLEGRKWAWTSPEPEACFTVVGNGDIIPGKFSTSYSSVMVFGTLARVSDDEQALKALRLLASRCQPERANIEEHLARYHDKTAVVLLKIHEMTGKRRERQ